MKQQPTPQSPLKKVSSSKRSNDLQSQQINSKKQPFSMPLNNKSPFLSQGQKINFESQDSQGSDISYESSIESQQDINIGQIQYFKQEMGRFFINYPQLINDGILEDVNNNQQDDMISFGVQNKQYENNNRNKSPFEYQKQSQSLNKNWTLIADQILNQAKQSSSFLQSLSRRIALYRSKIYQQDLIDVLLKEQKSITKEIELQISLKKKQSKGTKNTMMQHAQGCENVYFSWRKKKQIQNKMNLHKQEDDIKQQNKINNINNKSNKSNKNNKIDQGDNKNNRESINNRDIMNNNKSSKHDNNSVKSSRFRDRANTLSAKKVVPINSNNKQNNNKSTFHSTNNNKLNSSSNNNNHSNNKDNFFITSSINNNNDVINNINDPLLLNKQISKTSYCQQDKNDSKLISFKSNFSNNNNINNNNNMTNTNKNNFNNNNTDTNEKSNNTNSNNSRRQYSSLNNKNNLTNKQSSINSKDNSIDKQKNIYQDINHDKQNNKYYPLQSSPLSNSNNQFLSSTITSNTQAFWKHLVNFQPRTQAGRQLCQLIRRTNNPNDQLGIKKTIMTYLLRNKQMVQNQVILKSTISQKIQKLYNDDSKQLLMFYPTKMTSNQNNSASGGQSNKQDASSNEVNRQSTIIANALASNINDFGTQNQVNNNSKSNSQQIGYQSLGVDNGVDIGNKLFDQGQKFMHLLQDIVQGPLMKYWMMLQQNKL